MARIPQSYLTVSAAAATIITVRGAIGMGSHSLAVTATTIKTITKTIP